jgi:hypothetical protein
MAALALILTFMHGVAVGVRLSESKLRSGKGRRSGGQKLRGHCVVGYTLVGKGGKMAIYVLGRGIKGLYRRAKQRLLFLTRDRNSA